MNRETRYGALIIAAGMSSRMGQFKPLLPIGSFTLLERQIETFRSSGIEDIVIVTGYHSELIEEKFKDEVKTNKLHLVKNQYYWKNQMFDSICLGLEVLGKRNLTGIFVIPSDIPLFQCFTVKGMINSLEKNVKCKAIKPLYKQKSGHPILLNNNIIREIISYDGEGGLKGAIDNASSDQDIIKLDFIDKGILMDADTMNDYKRILKYDQYRQELTLEECYEIQDYFQMSDNVKRHNQKVSEIAIRIGKKLLDKGIDLDLNLLRNASLLHDIAKGNKNHELIGSEWLRDMGYTKIAEIVAEHNCICNPYGKVNEKMVVYLADKLVLEDKEVNIEERFQRALKKYGEGANARMNITYRMKLAIMIQEKILNNT